MKIIKLLLASLVIVAILFLCLGYLSELEEQIHQMTGWYWYHLRMMRKGSLLLQAAFFFCKIGWEMESESWVKKIKKLKFKC